MCRTVHCVWDRVSRPVSEGWACGRLIVLVSCEAAGPVGKPPAAMVLRGSQLPHLTANQGHWDAVLGKKTFFF